MGVRCGGYAQTTTTIWSEDWTGAKKDAIPSAVNANYSSTDKSTNSKTRVLNENLAKGTAPELLITKSWTVTLTDLGGNSGEFTLSFKSNNTSISVTANGVAVTLSKTGDKSSGYKATGSFTVSGSTAKLVLAFTVSSNSRIDDVTLTCAKDAGKQTVIDFEESGVNGNTYTVNEGEAFVSHKAKALDDSYEGKMKYSTTNASVADVDETTGEVTIGTVGTAVISAQFIGTDGYLNSNVVSYTINVVGDYVFYESFDKNTGDKYIGGNDGIWKGTTTKPTVTPATGVLLYDGDSWTDCVSENGANKCAKFGTSKNTGKATTPNITLSSNGVLTFKAAAWSGDGNDLTVTINGGGTLTYLGKTSTSQTFTLTDGNWGEYEMGINGASSFTITFAANKKRFFLDEVKVKEDNSTPEVETVAFDESSDNTITAAQGVTVTLKRPMKAGQWNTFCVPFDISAEQVKSQFGENAEVAELYTSDEKNMMFTTSNGIVAGFPYIVKPSVGAPDGGYVFSNVNVEAGEAGYMGDGGNIIFKGIYAPTNITDNLPENTFAAGLQGNIVKKATSGNMKGFRAYFIIPNSMAATSFMISIDGTPTSIDAINGADVVVDAPVYNLQGQRVGNSLNGLRSGVYIQNGKKIVVK